MIRIFMFLLTIGIIFSESNTRFELKEEINQDLTISFNIKNYELETDGEYTHIKLNNHGTRTLIGEPLLPSFSSFVQLDKNKSYDIEYNIITKKDLYDINIYPLQSFEDNQSNTTIIKR